MLLLLQDAGVHARADAPDAYVVHAGERRGALALARRGDAARRTARASCCTRGGGSFKSQMKQADASGARYALIVGDDEAGARQRSRIKPLREAAASRRTVAGDGT